MLLVTAPARVAPSHALLDSLARCEGVMAYRVAYDSTVARSSFRGADRDLRSSAIEGELKDRWIALLTAPGLESGSDCEPVCLRCQDRVRFRLQFPPLSDSFQVNVLWDDHRVDVIDRQRVIAHRTLEARDSAWVTLLTATFPTDSVTATLRASDPTPRSVHALLGPQETVFVDVLPEVSERVAPEWPRDVHGPVDATVLVMALVGANGRVLDCFARESDPRFDEAALRAVRHWEFLAARCGGRRVAVWVTVPIHFAHD